MTNQRYIFNNYINIARTFVSEKNLFKALKFYNKAYKLQEGKEDIELILDMALLYDKVLRKDMSEEKYREVLELDENEARAYYGLAVLYDEDGFYNEAIEFYNKAI